METELTLKRAIIILGLSMVVTTAAFARPDLNAFINKKADSTAELVGQVKRDKSVMDRYMRHFGMTRTEVIEYLSSLRPTTLKEEGVYAI